MAVITPGDITFNGTEIKELNEAVFASIYDKPELQLFHTIVNGIKAKTQIVLLGLINGLTGKGSGGCSPADDTNTITMSQKYWQPATVSNSLPSCWTDLLASFWIYGTNNGIAKADLTKTDYFNFLIERYKDALLEEVLRIAWFGDTDAADVNASPAGLLTAGTDAAYFNKIDGFWKQIFAIVAATPARKTTNLTSLNAQATFATQEFDSTDTTNLLATKTLQAMKYNSEFRLRSQADLVYIVTQSISDQYEQELTSLNQSFTTERHENGMTILKYGGITIISFQFWDRMIRTYFSDGTRYDLPHRAVLTTKANLQIGTEDEANFGEFNVFYDQKTELNYLRTKYDIDAKVIQDELIQAAY